MSLARVHISHEAPILLSNTCLRRGSLVLIPPTSIALAGTGMCGIPVHPGVLDSPWDWVLGLVLVLILVALLLSRSTDAEMISRHIIFRQGPSWKAS